MKKQHPIDDLFKDRLEDFSLEAPMHLFDQVAAATVVDEPKSKRKGLWFLWVLLPLFLLGTGTFAYLTWPTTPQSSNELSYFPIELEGANVPTASDENLIETDDNQLSEEEQLPALTQVNEVSKATFNNTAAQSSTNINNATLENGQQQNTQSSTPSKPANSELETNTELENKIIASADEIANSKDQKESQALGSDKALNNSTPLANASLNLMGPLDLLSSEALLLENPLGDEELPIIGFGKKNWITTLDFMASMDFVMRQLEAKEDEFNSYARLRNNTETFRHGTSFGMRLSTVSETGFAVRSGLNYSTINEQLNHKIKEEELQTITTRFGADGSVIGSDTSITLVGTYRITNNRYTELDIPLLVGYEFIGQKASFSLNGGILINMLSAQKGEFVSPNTNDAVSFSSNDPNSYRAFRNRLGIGFYGSMGIYFQFKDNMQVLFEPYVKYRPGSVTVDAYVLDQRYLTAGLFVGLRKRIL